MSNCYQDQTHVHEVLGSVRIVDFNNDPHNHRFAGVTEEVKFLPNGDHFHKFISKTDFYEDHFHPICVKTGIQVLVGTGEVQRHVHFIDSQTEVEDNHFHQFIAAVLINNPIGEEEA